MSDHLSHYLNMLGVAPDATLDEINTAYYCLLEKFSDNPTEEEAEYQQQLQHAYAVIRRGHTGPTPRKGLALNTEMVVPVAGGLALVALVAVLILNVSSIQLVLTRYEPGQIVRWDEEQAPYGEILKYESEHRFHTGDPTPAYEIRLAKTGETVWLSHRVVVKGMTEMDPQEARAAGLTGN